MLVLPELDHDLGTEALPLQEEMFRVDDWGMILAGCCEGSGPAAAGVRHGQE